MRQWLAALAIATLALPPSVAVVHAQITNGSQPIATRQNMLQIPFRLEPPRTPADQPAEIQLEVSTDGGQSWTVAQRVRPESGQFTYQAPHDGEYWFSIRAVDARGNVRPQGVPRAGLKVLVDTIAPRLEFVAARGSAGEVVARWRVVDPDLQPDSLKIEYQVDRVSPWQTVAIANPVPDVTRRTLSGETAWWPERHDGAMTVRATVTDRAGNPASHQVQVTLNQSGNDSRLPPPGPTPNLSAPPATPLAREPAASDTYAPTPWPADRASSEPLSTAPSLSGAPSDPRGNWPPSQSDQGYAASDSGLSMRAAPPLGRRLNARPVSQGNTSPYRASLDFSRLPPGERARMVNARSFELEYDIDSVGPSGIAKVELWGTRDGGRSWQSYGVDADQRSPLSVHVDGEGVYGFRILVQSGNGLGDAQPGPNDLPDIWVGVDMTEPQGRLLATEMGRDPGEVILRWEASDELPDARPVTLSFSERPRGPWTPIASGLENTGSYAWRLDGRVPAKVYLRLEVRDEAGNLGSFETAEPVLLDRQRPEGRIRGIRAVN